MKYSDADHLALLRYYIDVPDNTKVKYNKGQTILERVREDVKAEILHNELMYRCLNCSGKLEKGLRIHLCRECRLIVLEKVNSLRIPEKEKPKRPKKKEINKILSKLKRIQKSTKF